MNNVEEKETTCRRSPLDEFLHFTAYVTRKMKAVLVKQEEGVQQQDGMERAKIDGVVVAEEEEAQRDKECMWENLPEDFVIESVLTKLPARNLAVCCCVCKLWFNSISNDSRLSMVHYVQNKDKLSLVFNILNVSRDGVEGTYFFNLLGGDKTVSRLKFLTGFSLKKIHELVGFCNGLACSKFVSAHNHTSGSIAIYNPIRGESLVLAYVTPTGGYIYLCHGFGFDPLSEVYKAVIIFASEANNEILCMVMTLGTVSWRKIITIPPPLGSSPSPTVTRVPRTIYRAATLCGGDLLWRTQNIVGNNGNEIEIEMLLSFDLHNEKFQFIHLPTACTPTTATTHEPQYLVVDHLLEFKGYPCIARSERMIQPNDHYGHFCNYRTGVCCCCYKVHMYILKNKDKQVWTKEETFDVQISDEKGSLPSHLCWCFNNFAATPPPTRILTFSGQVLLYWFNGELLIVYNLQEKHLEVVECSRTYPGVFQSKMNEDLGRAIGDDDNIDCPSMDYQLHSQVENIVSLKTFIPKGAKTRDTDSADELMQLVDNNQAAGLLTTGRTKHTFSCFF